MSLLAMDNTDHTLASNRLSFEPVVVLQVGLTSPLELVSIL